ncbi:MULTISPECIES: MATE family efflux transporter [Mucilaginibacter]|uniref:MATE family efflux transporter n=1 Tax=Mucilaginibacter TaxID=423349 RepID=UPI0008716C43|nr:MULTISPECIES: MATE family efflux transporter [Mucilaginibacter]GGA98765.1 MATE family efflux transporter [Mucilaginibacter rubeus]SCW51105.1 putative efflux protein, MATE family [Mucilaginibacter sp. NFR10]
MSTIQITSSKLWNAIKLSLNGEQQDYTQGSIPKAIFLLAIPMILELSLESVFAVVDMFFVGKLGQNAIATVGLTESVITIVYSIAIGLSTAATAIVARRIGEKKPEAAAHAGAQALVICLITTIIVSMAGVLYAPEILKLMGASEEVVRDGAIFTRIMLGSSLIIILLFLINGIFRGAGDAAMAMKSLWIASIINIILCPVFIHFFGLKGAAMATVIGRSCGVTFQVYHLFKGSGILKFRSVHFNWDPAVVKTIIAVAWPATFQFIIASGSWIILTRLVAETGGTAASAGYQIAFRNFVFFILPCWGLSNAAATLVGQNLGAGHVERAAQSVLLTARYNAVLMSFVMLLFLFFARPIISIFTTEPVILNFGSTALRIIGSGFIFYAIAMVMSQALNGAGDTKTPTWINFGCFWLFQVPLAYLLAKGLGWHSAGAIAAVPAAEALLALVSWYYFKKGNWKKVKV